MIQLDPTSIMNVPLHNYPNDFSFIVNGVEFKTSRIVADILSPVICKIHASDPTINTFYINTQEKGNFSRILNLVKFNKINLAQKEIPFTSEVVEILGNSSIKYNDNSEKVMINNVFSLIREQEKKRNFYSSQLIKEINFIASNFYEICESHTDELFSISPDTLFDIINSENLQINSEDQLLFFINKLYTKDAKYSIFYDNILFENVSSFAIRDFLSIFDIDDINQSTWNRISARLEQDLHSNEKQTNSNKNNTRRYRKTKENTDKEQNKNQNRQQEQNRNQNRQQEQNRNQFRQQDRNERNSNNRHLSPWTSIDLEYEPFNSRTRQNERNEILRTSQTNDVSRSPRAETNLNQRTVNERSRSTRTETNLTQRTANEISHNPQTETNLNQRTANERSRSTRTESNLNQRTANEQFHFTDVEENMTQRQQTQLNPNSGTPRTFTVPETGGFNGIINYLRSQSPIDSVLRITASSIINNRFIPFNVTNFDSKSSCFQSKDVRGSWICFDFLTARVNPTNYLIRSRDCCEDSSHPKNWVIEGSNDNLNWTVLDDQRNCEFLNGYSQTHTFDLSNPTSSYFRYIRMRMTGKDCQGLNILMINAFEIYGSIN